VLHLEADQKRAATEHEALAAEAAALLQALEAAQSAAAAAVKSDPHGALSPAQVCVVINC
jgi:hypothetical protein